MRRDMWRIQRGILTAAAPAPFRRMECEAGLEAQVDFGRGARIVTPDSGGDRRDGQFSVSDAVVASWQLLHKSFFVSSDVALQVVSQILLDAKWVLANWRRNDIDEAMHDPDRLAQR